MANQQQLFTFMEPVAPVRHRGANLAAPQKELSTPQPSPKNDASGDMAQVSCSTQRNAEAAAEGVPQSPDSVLQQLRRQVGCLSSSRLAEAEVFSTGCTTIDSWLPAGGLHPQTLTEWVAADDSAAAGSLALLAAARRLRQIPDRPLVIIDCEGCFYPPAAVALGIPENQIILIRPRRGSDAIWALDQSLRSAAVSAVWAHLPMQLDDRDARRLQLAAESGHTPGLLVRGFHARGTPGFSEARFYVAQTRRKRQAIHAPSTRPPFSGRNEAVRRGRVLKTESDFETISITLDRVRGGKSPQHLAVQIDDFANLRPITSTPTRRHETAAEHLASQLANPAVKKRVAARHA